MNKAVADKDYAVLLYPPIGVPRVVELPRVPAGFPKYPLATFGVRTDAEAALEKFLTDNPEYRRWRDGRLVPQA